MKNVSVVRTIKAAVAALGVSAVMLGGAVGASAATPMQDPAKSDASIERVHTRAGGSSADYTLAESGEPQVTPFGAVTSPIGPGSCTLNTGPVYKRTSGGVGGHPTTTCTMGVTSISHSTTIYKHVWWGLQQVGGPFTAGNTGQSKMEQKNATVACADNRMTTFRMETRGTIVYGGKTYVAAAYEEAELACGTNP